MRHLWLVGLWWLLVPSSLRAATVAVLPLTPDATSDAHPGLGKGLAQLFVVDLARLATVTPIERERVQAVLDDEESRSPRAIGGTLGADWVLVGSWTVVGEGFELRAKLLDVPRGRLLADAHVQGTVEHFVAVHKATVQQLADQLGIRLSPRERRALVIQTPTEVFRALAAYGEGLDRADRGDAAGARAAFARALAVDPRFLVAHEALVAMGGARRSTVGSRDRPVPARFVEGDPTAGSLDVDRLAALAVRLEALRSQGRHCERAAEMRRHLARTNHRIGAPPGLTEAVQRLALESADSPAEAPSAGITRIFASTGAFVIDLAHQPYATDDRGLVASMAACLEPGAFLDELDQLAASLDRAGLSSTPVGPPHGLTWQDTLDVAWALAHARTLGPDPALTARVGALLSRYPPGSPAGTRLYTVARAIQHEAEREREARRRRAKRSDDELVRIAAGLLGRDPQVVALDNLYCRYMADHAESTVGPPLAERNPHTGERPTHAVDHLAAQVGPLADFGCLRGEPPRFRDVHEAWAVLQAAIEPGPPNPSDPCRRSLARARRLELDETLVERLPESYRGFNGWLASFTYWNLVRIGCLPEE